MIHENLNPATCGFCGGSCECLYKLEYGNRPEVIRYNALTQAISILRSTYNNDQADPLHQITEELQLQALRLLLM